MNFGKFTETDIKNFVKTCVDNRGKLKFYPEAFGVAINEHHLDVHGCVMSADDRLDAHHFAVGVYEEAAKQ